MNHTIDSLRLLDRAEQQSVIRRVVFGSDDPAILITSIGACDPAVMERMRELGFECRIARVKVDEIRVSWVNESLGYYGPEHLLKEINGAQAANLTAVLAIQEAG